MQNAILCRNLHKRYDSRTGAVDAVRGLDLAVERGECFGLLGPNGAGKTTTIEILEGLLPPTSGEVVVLGQRWGTSRDHQLRQRIGISLQETKLSEKLSVRETLTLFRSFYLGGITPEQAMRRVSLEEKASSWVGKLSGGQRQRLAVACALVGDPELLFLDEPTTGLDPQARRQLWEIIRAFPAEGRTVLLTTHYLDEAERLCDRVAIIDLGKVIALGSPRDLIASLGGEHVVQFALANHSANGSRTHDPARSVPPRTPAASSRVPELSTLNSQLSTQTDPRLFSDLPTVRSVRQDADEISLTVGEPHIALPALMDRLRSEGLELSRLSTRHASLEDVFVALTGRHLRDGEPTPS